LSQLFLHRDWITCFGPRIDRARNSSDRRAASGAIGTTGNQKGPQKGQSMAQGQQSENAQGIQEGDETGKRRRTMKTGDWLQNQSLFRFALLPTYFLLK